MTAPLHLAHARQPPPEPQGKRKGGGGGSDGYDRVVERIYRDDRMGRKTREIALLLAWLVARDPNRFGAGAWHRAEAILGTRQYGRHTQSVAALLVADDLPRYDIDRRTPAWHDQTCAAPMIRRSGLCGQEARDHSYSVDPETGWRTPIWYCRRHEAFGRQVDRGLVASPEPIPNRGGILPTYFRLADGPDGWVKNYRWAAHQADPFRTTVWEPPSHGIVAADWPRAGEAPPALVDGDPVRLHLAALDGELLGPSAVSSDPESTP